jgi:hypothetical protein
LKTINLKKVALVTILSPPFTKAIIAWMMKIVIKVAHLLLHQCIKGEIHFQVIMIILNIKC